MVPQITMVSGQLSANIDEVKFIDSDGGFAFLLKHGGGGGSGAKFWDSSKGVDFGIENCVETLTVQVSNPLCIEVVPYCDVDPACTDDRAFAVYVKEGVQTTQYALLGTIKITATLKPGSFSDNPSNTITSPTICLYAAEVNSGIPAAVNGIASQVLYTPRRVQLNWQDVSGEASYKIQRRYNGGAWADLANPAAGQTSYSDTTVVPGVYQYQIKAVNSYGSSAYVSSSTCGVS
jgi:hypothetical protein